MSAHPEYLFRGKKTLQCSAKVGEGLVPTVHIREGDVRVWLVLEQQLWAWPLPPLSEVPDVPIPEPLGVLQGKQGCSSAFPDAGLGSCCPGPAKSVCARPPASCPPNFCYCWLLSQCAPSWVSVYQAIPRTVAVMGLRHAVEDKWTCSIHQPKPQRPQLTLQMFPTGSFFFFQDFIYLFLERGKGREKERERNIDRLPLACSQLGAWPKTQTCALTRNRTKDLSFCGMTPNPLSHTGQGPTGSFSKVWLLQFKISKEVFFNFLFPAAQIFKTEKGTKIILSPSSPSPQRKVLNDLPEEPDWREYYKSSLFWPWTGTDGRPRWRACFLYLPLFHRAGRTQLFQRSRTTPSCWGLVI